MPRISLQHGFSLIEVLVAVLVIAIGLLGVAGMQLVGLKGNQQSFSKNQAAHHAQAILERMRGNPAAVISDSYLFDSTTYNCAVEPAENCGLASATCTPAQIASYDLFRAYCGRKGGTVGGIKGDLSNATLNISCPVDCETGVALMLGWDEQLLGNEGKKSGDKTISRELTINTVIGE
ncbi:type IV pilus modification protein PilV [Leucothrix pacifica]|uniref:Type IV pilus modification protein PilV n=1 Tax=Leucothrix pacifica TaxID=1247513 RepID=A0A317CNV9_9GAMM|nr:type IV pilus modification protein PilV [Leucothrix pacifica]PWQ99173.1 type IV pilus modification protein PilV [Leucothrix pacifica]